MKKNLLIYTLASFLIFTFATTAAAKKITLVTDPFPPYYSEKNGKTFGLQYELANIVFREMRMSFEIKFMPWKRALLVAESLQADGVFGLRKTKQRLRWLIYPDEPLMVVKTVIFHRNDTPFEYTGIESLTGKKVGTIKGYTYGKDFDKSKLFKREEVSSLKLNFMKLAAGRVDLVAAYKAVGIYTLEQMGMSDKILFSYKPVHNIPMYIGFARNPGNGKLAAEFSRRLVELKKSPECAELIKRMNIYEYMPNPCYKKNITVPLD